MNRKTQLEFEIIAGSPNSCIAINGTRVTSSKLYGFGHVVRQFRVSKDRIRDLIRDKDKVTFHLLDFGRRGVFLEGVRITNNGSRNEYQQYLATKAQQKALLDKCWSKKRLHAYLDGSEWVVDAREIRDRFGRNYDW